jgi:hypothetical protein
MTSPTTKELDGWIAYVTTALARIDSGRTERTDTIRAGRPPETVDPAFGLWVDESLAQVREIAQKIGAPDLVAEFNDRDPDTAEKACQQLLDRLRELRTTKTG